MAVWYVHKDLCNKTAIPVRHLQPNLPVSRIPAPQVTARCLQPCCWKAEAKWAAVGKNFCSLSPRLSQSSTTLCCSIPHTIDNAKKPGYCTGRDWAAGCSRVMALICLTVYYIQPEGSQRISGKKLADQVNFKFCNGSCCCCFLLTWILWPKVESLPALTLPVLSVAEVPLFEVWTGN